MYLAKLGHKVYSYDSFEPTFIFGHIGKLLSNKHCELLNSKERR